MNFEKRWLVLNSDGKVIGKHAVEAAARAQQRDAETETGEEYHIDTVMESALPEQAEAHAAELYLGAGKGKLKP